jgi:prepilin-type N-terminal cleavage/methylation domain-containing protein/prepilin-type processing-associated H-X9-DG protein
MRHRAFSLIEIVVVIGIIAILMAILLATVEKVRHQAYRANCASNLRQVGQAVLMYVNEHHGEWPRTTYLPGAPPVYGTGSTASDPFAAAGGPVANDVTASVFLLLRVAKLPPAMVMCPYNDVNVFHAEPKPVLSRANFTDYKTNLGYSFANPYPDPAAVTAGYKLSGRLSAEFAVAADLNPGVAPPRDDVRAPTPGAVTSVQKLGLSRNHEKRGQNVLFGDGHVQWHETALCGVRGDNIYTNTADAIDASPVGKDDTILLPTN